MTLNDDNSKEGLLVQPETGTVPCPELREDSSCSDGLRGPSAQIKTFLFMLRFWWDFSHQK